MATLPHDLTDLYFAPVVLAIDARIAELSLLDARALSYQVGMASDTPDLNPDLREAGLLRAIEHLDHRHLVARIRPADGARLHRPGGLAVADL